MRVPAFCINLAQHLWESGAEYWPWWGLVAAPY